MQHREKLSVVETPAEAWEFLWEVSKRHPSSLCALLPVLVSLVWSGPRLKKGSLVESKAKSKRKLTHDILLKGIVYTDWTWLSDLQRPDTLYKPIVRLCFHCVQGLALYLCVPASTSHTCLKRPASLLSYRPTHRPLFRKSFPTSSSSGFRRLLIHRPIQSHRCQKD